MTYKIGEMSHIIEHTFCWFIIVKLIEEWKKPRSGHYQHEEIHTTSTGEIVFYSFFLITSVISMEIIVGNQLTLFLHSCLTLILLSLIFSMRLWKSTSIHRLLYTPGKDYVLETNGSNCPIIPSSPYQPIIITHTRLSILVDWR